MTAPARADLDRLAARAAPILAFVAAYYVALWGADQLNGSLAVPSPFWFPDSVLLCALLLIRRDRWWVVIAAVWAVRVIAIPQSATPAWFILTAIANDSVKGILTAWLLQRVLGNPTRLDTLYRLFVFLGIAALAVPLLSALAAAPLRHALGYPFWTGFYSWWLSDALTHAVVTPTLLYWYARRHDASSIHWREWLLHSAGLIAVLLYAFVVPHAEHTPALLYAPVPFLIWAAVRFRPFGTANAIALVAIVAVLSASDGMGAFAGGSAANNVLLIQLFLLLLAGSLLSLSTLIAENDAAKEQGLELSSRLIAAQEHERSRIAREIHDDFGQRIALLVTELDGVRRDLNGGPPHARERLGTAIDTATTISGGIHDLSHQLHPSTLEVLGLLTSLKGLCRTFSEQHQLNIRLTHHNITGKIPDDVSLALFRIAQEALRNVVKHSGTAEATVALSGEPDTLVLCVSDNGEGFDTSALTGTGGLGLVSMRERLRPIRGQLSIRSAHRNGTEIRVSVPTARDAGLDASAGHTGGASSMRSLPQVQEGPER